MTHAVCAECKKEFDYELTPGFPRKYCVECSAIKKAEYANKQPSVIDKEKAITQSIAPQTAKHDIVISRTEKPHSYEFGKAGMRHKIYYGTVDELRLMIAELKAAKLIEPDFVDIPN